MLVVECLCMCVWDQVDFLNGVIVDLQVSQQCVCVCGGGGGFCLFVWVGVGVCFV